MSEHSGNELPLSRRDALAAMAAGAGVALSACTPGGDETGGAGAEGADGGATVDSQGPRAWVKDSSPFVQHGTNLETRLADLDGLLTPNDLFFVRNHAPTPVIDPAAYRLTVGGPGAETEVELSLDDLRSLPGHTLISYLECAGNWRGFFQRITGRTASGSQWGTGAVGCAEWSGPRLGDVLGLAGVRGDAVEVNVIGLDEAEWSANDGPWAPARLIGNPAALPHAWARFEFEWEATPGSHVIRTRATDAAGNAQPLEGVYNEKGYLLNVALPHPVEVG